MADIGVQPIILQDVDLTLGTDDFAAACSSAVLTPSTSLVTWKGLKPAAKYSAPTSPTWTLDLTLAQDYAAATSLAGYLFAHKGEIIPMTFKTGPDQATWAADVFIAPGAIGGGVDTVPESTVSLGVDGQPTPTYPV